MTNKDAFGEWLGQKSKLLGYTNKEYLYQQAHEGITGAFAEEIAREAFLEGLWYSRMVDQ